MNNLRESQIKEIQKGKKVSYERISKKEMSEHSVIALKNLSLTASAHKEIFQNYNLEVLLVYLKKMNKMIEGKD